MKDNFSTSFSGKMAALTLAAGFMVASGGAAQAQMARPLQFSSPLLEILLSNPTYQDMLKQFRDLVNSPAREKLNPGDFQSMALFAFQGVAQNAVTTADALETITLMHSLCPDPLHRRAISNAAKDILRFRPKAVTEVSAAFEKMLSNETDDNVRAYIEGMIKKLEMSRASPAP